MVQDDAACAPGDEIITMVDSRDRPIGTKSRCAMRREGGIYRVTHILLFNSRGELLVQTRSAVKDWWPGRIDLAAGGIVQADEDYALSARRELQEELGVTPPLHFCFKVYYEDLGEALGEDTGEDTGAVAANQNWGAVFRCVHDGPFALQPSEVAAAGFMPVEQAMQIPRQRVTLDTYQVLLAYLLS